MTASVVEVGPGAVYGPGSPSLQQVSVALECIDDEIALLDDHVVDVGDLWRDILRAAAGGPNAATVVVVPTWWPAGRVEVVTAAAEAVFAEVVVVQRSILARDGAATVIELSTDYAVVTSPSSDCHVLYRDSPEIDIHLEASSTLLVDLPAGVAPLPAELTARLRRLGVPLAHNTRHRMRDAAAQALADTSRRGRPITRPGRRTIAVMAGLALAVSAAAGGWAAQAFTTTPTADDGTRLLTEGRIAVRVPAAWAVERITGGAGSARVRVAPEGGLPALHITQSAGPAVVTLDNVAETLRDAIASETPGVFVDFEVAGERGGRPAVTYVERRAGTETRWAVVVDGATRIAIGCQHPTQQRDLIEDVCVRAVLSAQEVQ